VTLSSVFSQSCNSSTSLSPAAKEPSLASNLLSRSQNQQNFLMMCMHHFTPLKLLLTSTLQYVPSPIHQKQIPTILFTSYDNLQSTVCLPLVPSPTQGQQKHCQQLHFCIDKGVKYYFWYTCNRFATSETRNTESPCPGRRQYLEASFSTPLILR